MSSRGPADGYQNFRRSRSPLVRKSAPENEYDRAFFRATGMLPFVSAGDRDRRAPAAGPWVTMHKALFCLLRRFSARCTKLQAETRRRMKKLALIMIVITIVITMMVITISWRSFQISWRFAA